MTILSLPLPPPLSDAEAGVPSDAVEQALIPSASPATARIAIFRRCFTVGSSRWSAGGATVGGGRCPRTPAVCSQGVHRPSPVLVDEDGEEEDAADGDVLPEGLQVHDHEAARERGGDEGADNGSGHLAATAPQRRASDDHGSD